MASTGTAPRCTQLLSHGLGWRRSASDERSCRARRGDFRSREDAESHCHRLTHVGSAPLCAILAGRSPLPRSSILPARTLPNPTETLALRSPLLRRLVRGMQSLCRRSLARPLFATICTSPTSGRDPRPCGNSPGVASSVNFSSSYVFRRGRGTCWWDDSRRPQPTSPTEDGRILIVTSRFNETDPRRRSARPTPSRTTARWLPALPGRGPSDPFRAGTFASRQGADGNNFFALGMCYCYTPPMYPTHSARRQVMPSRARRATISHARGYAYC